MLKVIWESLEASSLHKKGEHLMEQDRYAEAEGLFREALDLAPENSVKKGVCMSSLGYSLLKQGKVTEAEPLLRDGACRSDHGVKENLRYADYLMECGRHEEAIEPLWAAYFNDTNKGLDAREGIARKYRECLAKGADPDIGKFNYKMAA